MDALSMSTYLQTQYADQAKQMAESTANSISGISATSSREEIEDAVKDFETYMMEQVIKQMKETFTDDEDEDTTMSMYTDMYMDSAINKLASQLVDDLGDSITDDFVQQIMRNYGITGTTNPELEQTGVNNDDVSDDIASVNGTTVTQILT